MVRVFVCARASMYMCVCKCIVYIEYIRSYYIPVLISKYVCPFSCGLGCISVRACVLILAFVCACVCTDVYSINLNTVSQCVHTDMCVLVYAYGHFTIHTLRISYIQPLYLLLIFIH